MANPLQRRAEVYRVNAVTFWVAVFTAILIQTVLPLRFSLARLIDFPLLVTIYFCLLRRNKVFATLLGAAIGLLQDALAHGPVGMFGMAKTLVGYLAASASFKFDVEHSFGRFLVVGFCVLVHGLFLAGLHRVLFESSPPFEPLDLVSAVLMNMALALVLFQVLDRFKQPS